MEHRILGSTEIKLSEVSLGTWGLAAQAYGPVTDSRFERTVEAALDAGITTFDMAPLWGEGRAERIVGHVTAARRDELTYVSRAGAALQDGKLQHRFDADSLRRDCEESLRQLNTDRIDLWLLHHPPEETWQQQEWRETVERLREEGKIRAWGASVPTAAQARMAISAGAEAISIVYNLIASDALSDLADELSTAQCGVLACSPLAYGLLAGHWSAQRRFRSEDHRSRRWTSHALAERVRQVDELRFLVHDDVRSMTMAAIRFVLANAHVTSAVVGARAPHQAKAAVHAVGEGEPYLPAQDMERISQVLAATEGDG
jgi:aryl-alcohol dehydrogenase-like predicted oxidoreductase